MFPPSKSIFCQLVYYYRILLLAFIFLVLVLFCTISGPRMTGKGDIIQGLYVYKPDQTNLQDPTISDSVSAHLTSVCSNTFENNCKYVFPNYCATVSVKTWHNRLGHVSHKILNHLSNKIHCDLSSSNNSLFLLYLPFVQTKETCLYF